MAVAVNKLESYRYENVERIYWYMHSFRYYTRVWWTYRRTHLL